MTALCLLWLCLNPMRRIITIALVLCLTVTPCHGLTVFQTDYDGDGYTEERIATGCALAMTEGEDWLPLRKLSEVLPYEVEWNEQERTVYIHADRTHTIKPDWYLPEGVCIRDGVTYVTPAYMRRFLPGISFLYDGELYVFDDETVRSRLVRGSEDFRAQTLTVLYRLKLALPDDYKLIRRYLRGGIEEKSSTPGKLVASAYIYPTASRPTAYIVASAMTGANLAELIAHEAYHVYLQRQNQQSESKAIEYGRRVKRDLLNIT